MPTYDYRCEQNSRVVEVEHGISESVSNWGELCARAEIPLGDTDPAARVERAITGGILALPKRSGFAAKKKPAAGHTCGSGCSH